MANGFSQAVFLQDNGYWDTHLGNQQQRSLYNGLFRQLTQLMTALETAGLRETTTVLVVSEMGRTPVLNGNQGKDHWPFTSAMVIGPSVRNTVLGSTGDDLSGNPLTADRRIQTQDVLATVATLVGAEGRSMYPDAEVLLDLMV